MIRMIKISFKKLFLVWLFLLAYDAQIIVTGKVLTYAWNYLKRVCSSSITESHRSNYKFPFTVLFVSDSLVQRQKLVMNLIGRDSKGSLFVIIISWTRRGGRTAVHSSLKVWRGMAHRIEIYFLFTSIISFHSASLYIHIYIYM